MPAMFQCREKCGACCIAPSISSSTLDMPYGKAANTQCVHLDTDYHCQLFEQNTRPMVCRNLKPSLDMCGLCREDALHYLQILEISTQP